MYIIINDVFCVNKFRVNWGEPGKPSNQSWFKTKEEADTFAEEIRNKTITKTDNFPVKEENILLTYKDDKAIRFSTNMFNTYYCMDNNLDISTMHSLQHNKWDTLTATIDDYAFLESDSEGSISYSDGSKEQESILYIRKVVISDEQGNQIINRSFFDDSDKTQLHLRAGEDNVEEGVTFQEYETVKIPSDKKVFIEILHPEDVLIPKGSNKLTVTIEYYIDNPNVSDEPIIELIGNTATVIEEDTSEYDWLDGMHFESDAEVQKALSLGKDKYEPPVDDITAIQLAMAELYEGGII